MWHGVVGAALAALRRFPAALALAFVASCVPWLPGAYAEAVTLAVLKAFPWAVALRLFAETYMRGLKAVLPWAALLLTIPQLAPGSSGAMLAGAGLLAIVAAFPQARQRDVNGLWVQSLSLVIGAAAVALLIFAMGWALILLIIKGLFDVVLPGSGQMPIQAAILFGPWLALALWPGHREAPAECAPPLSGLLNWMLVPITFACLLLVNVYCLNIAVAGIFPRGIVAGITVGMTIGGGAVWALACGSHGRGAQWLARSFWLLLLLPTVALIVAARQRVAQYGFTEERYLLFLCAAVVLVMAGFQAVHRALPTPSLAGLVGASALVFASIGPWGATAVSVGSQFDEFLDALDEAGMMRDRRILLRDPSEPLRSVPRAASALWFLVQRGRDELVVERLDGTVELPAEDDAPARGKRGERLAGAIGLSPVPAGSPFNVGIDFTGSASEPVYVRHAEDANYFHIGRGRRALVDIEGYAYATPVVSLRGQVTSSVTLDTPSGLLDIVLTPDGAMTARFGAEDEATFDLVPALRRHQSDKSSPIIVTPATGQIPTRLILHSADWIVSKEGDITIQALEAQLLIGRIEK